MFRILNRMTPEIREVTEELIRQLSSFGRLQGRGLTVSVCDLIRKVDNRKEAWLVIGSEEDTSVEICKKGVTCTPRHPYQSTWKGCGWTTFVSLVYLLLSSSFTRKHVWLFTRWVRESIPTVVFKLPGGKSQWINQHQMSYQGWGLHSERGVCRWASGVVRSVLHIPSYWFSTYSVVRTWGPSVSDTAILWPNDRSLRTFFTTLLLTVLLPLMDFSASWNVLKYVRVPTKKRDSRE